MHRTKTLISRIFNKTETLQDIEDLRKIVKYPAFVGSHSKNAGVNYMNLLYTELSQIAMEIQEEKQQMRK